MPKKINLETYVDNRGSLSVIEDIKLPFKVKRVFYIYNVDNSKRGGHRHKKTIQALICINGECKIYSTNGEKEEEFLLNKPNEGLILMPEDWHIMRSFSKNTILLVLASEYFEIEDYIFDKY